MKNQVLSSFTRFFSSLFVQHGSPNVVCRFPRLHTWGRLLVYSHRFLCYLRCSVRVYSCASPQTSRTMLCMLVSALLCMNLMLGFLLVRVHGVCFCVVGCTFLRKTFLCVCCNCPGHFFHRISAFHDIHRYGEKVSEQVPTPWTYDIEFLACAMDSQSPAYTGACYLDLPPPPPPNICPPSPALFVAHYSADVAGTHEHLYCWGSEVPLSCSPESSIMQWFSASGTSGDKHILGGCWLTLSAGKQWLVVGELLLTDPGIQRHDRQLQPKLNLHVFLDPSHFFLLALWPYIKLLIIEVRWCPCLAPPDHVRKHVLECTLMEWCTPSLKGEVHPLQ